MDAAVIQNIEEGNADAVVRLLNESPMARSTGNIRRRWLETVSESAGSHPNLALFKALHKAGYLIPEVAGIFAALQRHLPCVQLAHQLGARRKILEVAAKLGDMPLLQYCMQHRQTFEWGPKVMCAAAFSGKLEVLDFVIAGGCTPNSSALVIAAAWGHLACVRRLHKLGVPVWEEAGEQLNIRSLLMRVYKAIDDGVALPANKFYLTWPGILQGRANGVMRYGQVHGAPLPDCAGGRFLQPDRERTQMVLRCFAAAPRLAKSGGENAKLWEVMARVPGHVVEEILVLAWWEIPESFQVEKCIM